MYYLKDETPSGSPSSSAKGAPVRAFVKEELMQIPENMELPPDYVKNW